VCGYVEVNPETRNGSIVQTNCNTETGS
jgi:hypothetical protein